MRILPFALLAVCVLSAQTFEVASVKRAAPETGNGSRYVGAIPQQQQPGRINYPNVNLMYVIARAYGVAPDRVTGLQWLSDERYDIAATFPAGVSQDRRPAMLQHLLADRFRMTVHEETKPLTGFALVAGKGGPKLTKAADNSQMGFTTTADSVTFRKSTVAGFARTLALFTGRPVSDETGIQGEYDIPLRASMDDIKSGSISGAISDLGLKLETRTAPAKFIVVDKANKIPTEN